MDYEIKLLDLMDVDVESSFLVLAHDMGIVTRAKTWAYLLLGGDDPILVDTGASSPEIMGRLGMTGHTSEEQRLERQLAKHGVGLPDVRWILHTHTHIDHAGQDDRFPEATVVMTRRELEFSASGLMGAQYPPEYVKHHIDRLHARRALRLLDLDLTGPDELFPGIVCELTGGHTEGSMNILVEHGRRDGVPVRRRHVRRPQLGRRAVPRRPRLRAAGHGQSCPQQAPREGGDQEGSQVRPLRPHRPRLSGADGRRSRRRAHRRRRDPGARHPGRRMDATAASSGPRLSDGRPALSRHGA